MGVVKLGVHMGLGETGGVGLLYLFGLRVLDTLKGGAVPPDQVFNMLQTARKYTNLPANVYNHALQLSTNTLEIYGMMQKDGIAPDTLACSMILKDLMQKGHTTQVLDFLFDADKHGVRLQTRTLCALTLFFSRNHEYPNVLTCYDKIPAGAKLGPAVYYAALSSCREKPEKLLGVLHRMHQEDIKPNASILQFIVWTLRSMPRKAAEIFEENSVDDLRVLEQMVGIYSSLGEPEKAVNVLEKIAKPHWKLCYSAIFGCTYKEHLSLALRVVAHMKVAGIRPSASIFNHVILLCEKARDPVKAVELISEMRQHNIRPSLLALNNLVQLLAIQDFWEQAIVVIDTMLEDSILTFLCVRLFDVIRYASNCTNCQCSSEAVNRPWPQRCSTTTGG